MNYSSILEQLTKDDLSYILYKLNLKKRGTKGEQIIRILDNTDINTALNHLPWEDIASLTSFFEIPYTTKKDTINNIINQFDKKLSLQTSFECDVNNHQAELDKLEQMVGLINVKNKIYALRSFLEIQKQRKEHNLETIKTSNHMIFTGNPGTGKTSVARIVGHILNELGILSKGHYKEVTRSDFIGKYVGHTEAQAKEILDEAAGGVLFIDEAYSLFQDKSDSYGSSVVTALLTALENNRHDMVVILAGYKEEMDDFLDSDPGLKSRFSNHLHFDDYKNDELIALLNELSYKHDYILDAELLTSLEPTINAQKKFKHFANARYIRNLFEDLVKNQSARLAKSKEFDIDSLKLLTIKDI